MKISPYRRKRREFYGTIDIETNPEGELLDVGILWRTKDGTDYRCVGSWKQALEAMFESGAEKFYAHNGGRFDYVHLLETICRSEDLADYTVECLTKNSSIIAVILGRGEKRVWLCDSYRLFPVSLNKLAGDMLGKGKVEDSRLPHLIKLEDRQKYYDYLANDCRILLLSLEKFTHLVQDRLGKSVPLCITAGSQAVEIFRRFFLDKRIHCGGKGEVVEASRAAYRGGWTRVFRYGVFERVTVYDYNSMYLSVMGAGEFPAGNPRFVRRMLGHGVYRCTWNNVNPFIPLPTGGAGWLTYPEIIKYSDSCHIKVLNGYYWGEACRPFKQFADEIFAWRGLNPSLNLAAKLIGNNLYGKFSQRPSRESVCHLAADEVRDLLADGRSLKRLNPEFPFYTVIDDEAKEPRHSIPIWGTYITAMARMRLATAMESLDPSDILYCDTDSIHTTGSLPCELVGGGLGMLKIEYQAERAVYAGRKLYALQNGNDEKVRVKGVSLTRCREAVKFAHIESLLTDKKDTLTCRFLKFPTWKENLMSQRKAAKMFEVQRVIRAT